MHVNLDAIIEEARRWDLQIVSLGGKQLTIDHPTDAVFAICCAAAQAGPEIKNLDEVRQALASIVNAPDVEVASWGAAQCFIVAKATVEYAKKWLIKSTAGMHPLLRAAMLKPDARFVQE